MSHPDSTEQLQLLVIDYLYGELDEEERERFEKTLESNDELQRLLEAEQRLNSALPAGAQPLIDEERVTPPCFDDKYTWIHDSWDHGVWELPVVKQPQ